MSKAQEWTPKCRADMTPMIDVVFLLLIFFLCTLRFQTLEGKLAAFLPKDAGVNSGVAALVERISIQVQRTVEVDTTDRNWVWTDDQVRIRVGSTEVKGLAGLDAALQRIVAVDPKQKLVLRPMPRALYIDAVKVLDSCLRVGLDQITFEGNREL